LWLPVHKPSSCWPNLIHAFTLVMTHIFGEYALFVSCLFFFCVFLLFFVVLPLSSYFFACFDNLCFCLPDSFSRCHCFVLFFFFRCDCLL
jgi:hypothetical protein